MGAVLGTLAENEGMTACGMVGMPACGITGSDMDGMTGVVAACCPSCQRDVWATAAPGASLRR